MQWTELSALTSDGGPGPLWGHACVASDDRLIVVGGLVNKEVSGGQFSKQLHQLDVSGDLGTWSVVNAKSLNGVSPEPRAFHSLTLCGNRVVMFGGLGADGTLGDLHIFNLDSPTWLQPSVGKQRDAEYQPPPEAAHSHHAVALDDNNVLVLGGQTSHNDDLLDHSHIYQLKTRSWYHLPMLAAASKEPLGALSQHACIYQNGKLWVLGGLRPQYVKKRRQFVAAHQYVNTVVVVSHVEGPHQAVCTPHTRNRKRINHLEQQVGAWRESSKDLQAEKKRRERKEKSGKEKLDKAERKGREKLERAERRIKKKFTASSPMKVVHKMHIDKDFNWAGDPDQCFALMDKLGDGAFGAVYRGVMRSTGSVMAIKVIRGRSVM
jgi:Galactose oxidase, central domain